MEKDNQNNIEDDIDNENIAVDEENDEIEVSNDDEGSEGGEQKEPEETIEDLKKQIEEANKKREEAEAIASEARDSAKKNEEKAASAQEIALKNASEKLETAIGSAEDKIASLQKQYKEAYDSGDSEELAKANEALLDAKIDLRQLRANKVGLEQYREKVKKQAEAQSEFSSSTQDWIKKNPKFNTDIAFRKRAIAAHYAADAQGITVDTPEYFEFIDNALGTTVSDGSQEQAEPKKTMFGAAPSRAPAVTKQKSGNGRFVTLTAAQKEAAEICGMTEAEYAKNLQQ